MPLLDEVVECACEPVVNEPANENLYFLLQNR